MPSKSRKRRNRGKPRKGPTQYHHPASIDELTEQNIQTIIQLDDAASAHRSTTDKIAQGIASFCGSIQFVWIHVIWFGGWIIFNSLPGLHHIDPFPFIFLTLVVSLEAIFLSTFILISQNYSARLSERRNHLDLQINLLSEQENTKILNLVEKIAQKVGVDIHDNPTLDVLDQTTNPSHMSEQIEEAIKRGATRDKI